MLLCRRLLASEPSVRAGLEAGLLGPGAQGALIARGLEDFTLDLAPVARVVGVFALAGIPPFVGFMGKLTLLSAALNTGHIFLVIIAVINAAIAVYYYLCVVREVAFRDPGDRPPLHLDWPTRVLCLLLITGILALGVAPARVFHTLSTSVAAATGGTAPPPSALLNATR